MFRGNNEYWNRYSERRVVALFSNKWMTFDPKEEIDYTFVSVGLAELRADTVFVHCAVCAHVPIDRLIARVSSAPHAARGSTR